MSCTRSSRPRSRSPSSRAASRPGWSPRPDPDPHTHDRGPAMLTSQTTIEIDRPSRYLVQLCRHAAAMGKTGGGHRPRNHAGGTALARGDLQVHAENDETHGVITIT